MAEVLRILALGLLCLVPLQFAEGQGAVNALETDAALSAKLHRLVDQLDFDSKVEKHEFAVSLVDVTDKDNPRYAGVNDRDMMYAASLPKIAILLAGFEKIRQGGLIDSPAVRAMFTRMTRFSSNTDASKAVRMIGFESIANTLTSARYRLYDKEQNGGLWLGKAYGGPGDRWRRDPLHNLSHGATTLQTARFFTLLAQERLVDAQASRDMKEILSNPGIRHKFVKGLAGVPGVQIYRKSGTWRNWHADAALVEHDGRRYVAAALVEDPNGGKMLERLIRGLDEIVCGSVSRRAALD